MPEQFGFGIGIAIGIAIAVDYVIELVKDPIEFRGHALACPNCIILCSLSEKRLMVCRHGFTNKGKMPIATAIPIPIQTAIPVAIQINTRGH